MNGHPGWHGIQFHLTIRRLESAQQLLTHSNLNVLVLARRLLHAHPQGPDTEPQDRSAQSGIGDVQYRSLLEFRFERAENKVEPRPKTANDNCNGNEAVLGLDRFLWFEV